MSAVTLTEPFMVATARGMEPIEKQRFAPNFLAKWTKSQMLGDGLVHAFSKTHESLRVNGRIETHRGWATFCESYLTHNELPGKKASMKKITCVACLVGLGR